MMAYQHSSPDEALEIAAQCMHHLRTMRGTGSLGELKSAYASFQVYADARHVCRAIREHMGLVWHEESRRHGAKRPAQPRTQPVGE